MKNIQAKLQTFAGAMMVPIILLVLVGFFVGIGSAFTNYILQFTNDDYQFGILFHEHIAALVCSSYFIYIG